MFVVKIKDKFDVKINVNFQAQYIMLCVKIKDWGYEVRLIFKVKVSWWRWMLLLNLSFKFKNCGYVLEKYFM
jgi:hypothetical protein